MSTNGSTYRHDDNPREFDAYPCTRCSGDRSAFRAYGHVNNGKCLKCDGHGWYLTRRGLAAQQFYLDSLLTVAGADLEPGAKYRAVDSTAPAFRVVEVDLDADVVVTTTGRHGYLPGTLAERKFRRIPTPELRERLIAEAQAYEATLDRNGNPRGAQVTAS
jgi:hypothetical protein